MATKIKSLAIVSQQGVREYCVGQVYNDLLLAEIEDRSIEYPDEMTSIYVGLTHSKELVFEAINAPLDVQYQPA